MGEGLRRALLLAAMGFALCACGVVSTPFGGREALVPHPTYKIGAPYTVNGVTYYPHVDYTYDQTGLASWYGGGFQGHYTANGEIFDMNDLTAAHTTLPLPSIVEVVNLQNNRALRIRVNDRGPFARGRIIDLSRRAAQLLGLERTGAALVRVRVLREPSLIAAAAAERGIVDNGEAAGITVAAYRPPLSRRFFVASPAYHVQAGPVATEQDADRLRDQMVASGYRDAQVVID
ncbi:MAG: septal ring lytic transglycosylase RlpA family protein [Stellaceae bacterium]